MNNSSKDNAALNLKRALLENNKLNTIETGHPFSANRLTQHKEKIGLSAINTSP